MRFNHEPMIAADGVARCYSPYRGFNVLCFWVIVTDPDPPLGRIQRNHFFEAYQVPRSLIVSYFRRLTPVWRRTLLNFAELETMLPFAVGNRVRTPERHVLEGYAHGGVLPINSDPRPNSASDAVANAFCDLFKSHYDRHMEVRCLVRQTFSV